MAGPVKVKIDTLELDATLEQDYAGDVEVTDHPIEDGASPSDHARLKPETFTGTAVISSVPVTGGEGGSATKFPPHTTGGHARDVFDALKKMKDDRQLHTIVTPLRRYDNMLMTSLGSPTRAQYGDGVMVKFAFREVRIVQSGTAQFVTAAPTSTQKPTAKQNQAKKTTTPAEDNNTILIDATDTVGLTTPPK